MKVTLVPAQTGLADGAIETLTFCKPFTSIVMLLEVAGFPVAQVAFEVMMHLKTSLLDGVYTSVGELFPTFTPFLCHW